MCRNVRRLFNFDPPATESEVHDAALQFVRKISGFNKPSKTNADAFNCAVEEVSSTVHTLLGSLTTNAPKRNREVETAKLKARSAKRFGTSA